MLYSAAGLCLSPCLNPISYMGVEEFNQKVLRETKHCLDAGVSVLEMHVNEEFKELQSIFSTEVSPDRKPHAEQRTKKQEIKNSDFMVRMIKQHNRLHRNLVEFSSLMMFQG